MKNLKHLKSELSRIQSLIDSDLNCPAYAAKRERIVKDIERESND